MAYSDQIIIICGPTASGKSEIAFKLCKEFPSGVIINADAIQIYKDIPILTSQPTKEEQDLIPHKLYGFLSPDKKYSVANWLDDVKREIDNAINQKQTPILVGGSGMYISSLVNGIRQVPDIPEKIKSETNKLISSVGEQYLYQELIDIDKNSSEYIKNNDTHRIIRAYNLYQAFSITPTQYRNFPNKAFYNREQIKVFSFLPDRELLYKNCDKRFDIMVGKGAIEEVEKLVRNNHSTASPIAKAIGFKEFFDYIKGNITKAQAIDKAKQHTRNYAKRQITWFRNQLNNVDNIKQDNMLSLIEEIKSKIC